ncbi:protein kinase family protein [Nocardiopsis alba]|uniref:protein kinase family protein n=1 Tax=Nocardiopsis alba TaxID=53437 RepID=UPI0035DEB2DA
MFPLSPHDPPAHGVHRLHARLGEDACSHVYLASGQGQRPGALRIVRSEYTTDHAFRSAFDDIVGAAGEVDGRYVAPVMNADPRAATPWAMVTRPLAPPLSELVDAHGPLPEPALPSLALALAQGLADLHASGHVHGSLWPGGILIARPHAVIADVGFEKAVPGADRSPPHPGFAPPEGGLTTTADVFAWAATLCFAAGGVTGPEGLARVPLQLRGLVNACLQVDPRLRPDSADLVAMLGGPATPAPWPEDLVSLVKRYEDRAEDLLSEAKGVAPPASRLLRRRRTTAFVATGAALALVIGAGTAWGLLRLDRGENTATGPETAETGCSEGDAFSPSTPTTGALDAVRIAFSPDGDALAVTGEDSGLTLWNWRTGEEIARPTESVHPPGTPVFSPSGCEVAVLALLPDERGDGEYSRATAYDLVTGRSTEHQGPRSERARDGLVPPQNATSLAFSPSGDRLAVAVSQRSGLSPVGIVDTDTDEEIATWPVENARTVYEMRFLDEERIVAATSSEIAIHDALSGEIEQVVRDSSALGFALIPERSEIVYVGNGDLVRWDIDDWAEVDRVPIPDFHEARDDATVTGLSVDADLGLLHFGWRAPESAPEETRHHGHLFDLAEGTDLWEGEESPVPSAMTFHPEGEIIAAARNDGTVALLDPDTLEPVRVLP